MRRMGTVVALLCATLMMVMPASPASADAQVFVDSTPSPSWQVDGTVYTTLIVGDTVFVGGEFSNAVSPTGQLVARKNLAAFSMATGALITTWKADAGNVVRGLVSDGTSLWVAGNFLKLGGLNRSRLAKVDVASGVVDPAFAPTFDNSIRAIALDNGSIYAGGQFLNVNGVAKNRIAKLNATTGSLVTSFTTSASSAVYAVKASPVSDAVYLAGNFGTVNSVTRNGVAAVTKSTGAITGPAFASSAKPTFGLDVSPDGTQLFGAGGGPTNAAAAWNTATGTRTWRVVADGDIQVIKYFGGTAYFGFHDGYQLDPHVHVMAVDAKTGAIDTSFWPSVIGFWGLWALDITDEGMAIGGDFTTVAGIPAQGWARFPRSGDLPPPPPVQTEYLGTSTGWSYWDKGTMPAGWSTEGFDASSWATGLAQLGYGDGDESTVVSYGPSASAKYITTYFRATFDVTTVPDQLNLYLAADDGAVAYVNGTEVVRDNMPAGTITNTTRASTGRSGGGENALRQFAFNPAVLHPGTNTLAVEVHQDTPTSTDLTFDGSLVGIVVPPSNDPPTASFTSVAAGYTISYDGSASIDTDGAVTDWHWDFGDGSTGTGATVDHTYAAEGTYTVTLRVADNGGAHGTVVQSQLVQSPTVTTTAVAANATWSWRYATGEPPAGWNQAGFDDSTWGSGAAPLGFGSATIATNVDTFADPATRPKTAYFRHGFDIADLAKVQQVTVTTVADDGVAVYVNGVEVGRSNLPAGTLTSTISASSARSTTTANNNPVTFTIPVALLVQGANVITAETHVNTRTTADLSFKATVAVTALR